MTRPPRPEFSRRGFLSVAASAVVAAAGGAVLGSCAAGDTGSSGGGGTARPAGSAGVGRRPLVIPPLAPSRIDARGRRVFELVPAAATTTFLPGTATPTWGYGRSFGGPTLRARRGEQVLVRVTNRLPETTTVHWHGMSLPAAADGGPHQPIAPGATWEPSWRIEQPAATLWYHPHPHGTTERHVHRGLAGMFVIDDEDGPDGAGLPSRYGVDDFPVIVTDRTFTRDGAFDESGRNAHGLLGDTLLVNGTVAPFLEVDARRVRLRLVNASPARCYRFARSDGAPLVLAGTDGGLLPAPRPVPDVVLTPGERAEVVLDLAPGRAVRLRSLPQDLGAVGGTERAIGAQDTLDVLDIRPRADAPRPGPLPTRLPHEPWPDPAAAGVTRRFELGNNEINGRSMDMARIDEVVTAGATEVWELHNRHSRPHNLHVHDARGVVLEEAGHTVAPAGRSWKDTVYVAPKTTTRFLVRFGAHTDPARPYMYHCHLLYHEDQGMMGQFVVVEPGAEPSRTLPAAGAGHHG